MSRTVKNDAKFTLRALGRSDRSALAAEFERLGERTRLLRFLGPKKELTERELTRFSDLDHVGREAIAAIHPSDGSIIGVARYAVGADGDHVAEVAFEVVDEWQGRGVGRELTAGVIERARENGIRRLTASVLAENRPAIELLARFGFGATATRSGITEMQLQLTPAAIPRPMPTLARAA